MVLCLETATSVCSVALTENGKVIAFREINEGFSHAEKLTVFISEILEEAYKKVNDLDAVAVSSGPGSYTGLRIGVSVAKGLCLAADKPLISIPTLEAMAFGARNKIKVSDPEILFCPMIDARRMEVYCALYDLQLDCLHPSSAIVVTEEFFSDKRNGKKVYYFGDGAEKCRTILNDQSEFIFYPEMFPSAKYMAELAFKKFNDKWFENLSLFEPLYLKEYQPGRKK